MLGKLIKHDFRALSRTLFPLQIGVLGGALVATLFTTINLRLTESSASGEGFTFFKVALMGAGTLITGLIAFCIAASALVTLILTCLHFYQNLMGSEGYLTFTLPVTTGRIVWSKLICGMLWSLINAAVICLSILIFAVFGTVTEGFMNTDVLGALREMFSTLPEIGAYVNIPVLCLELLALVIATLAVTLLQAYFAITVGGRAEKHRLLASVGMYIALSIGVNILTTIVAVIFSLSSFTALSLMQYADSQITLFHRGVWLAVTMEAALSALFFLGTRGLLKNRLNLQ